MNSTRKLNAGIAPSGLCRALALALACAALVLDSSGQSTPSDYVLFQGADIYVGHGNDLKRVRDVYGDSWVVASGGKDQAVNSGQGPIGMKIDPVQKMTEVSAKIEGMKAEGAYTFANDPSVKLTRSLSQAADLSAGDAAAANQANAQTIVSMSATAGGSSTPTGTSPTSTALPTQSATVNGNDSLAFQGWNTGEGYDLLDVSFKVSSPVKLARPYMVVFTKFIPPGAAPGTFKDLVYAKALDPIGTAPVKIKFEQAGFPPGYNLLSLDIHLYNEGVEVATNMSKERKVMTVAEAFDYVKDAYLKAHRADTLAATPIMTDSLPSDFQTKLAEGDYSKTVYVKVSKDGIGEDAYADPQCTRQIDDPYLDTVVKCLRFKPALRDGMAVEGSSPVNLSMLRA
ncbi:MAG TPA: hypothetical protein VGG34_03950 [Opitutaceae bacterium]